MSMSMMGGLMGMPTNAAGAGSGGSSAAIPTPGSVVTGVATNADQFAKAADYLKGVVGGGKPATGSSKPLAGDANKPTAPSPSNAAPTPDTSPLTIPPFTPQQMQDAAPADYATKAAAAVNPQSGAPAATPGLGSYAAKAVQALTPKNDPNQAGGQGQTAKPPTSLPDKIMAILPMILGAG